MKASRRVPICALFFILTICALSAANTGSFEVTGNGLRFVIRDESGRALQEYVPEFDKTTGKYIVRDKSKNIIATQHLPSEAGMAQIKIVTPLQGNDHSAMTADYLGNSVPVLRELSASDPRYTQLKTYIENNPGLQKTIAMHLEARNMKITQLRQDVAAGVKDSELAAWLTNDLQKPVYLEIGDSGSIYHDPKGFVFAEQSSNGQTVYRDNSYTNRLVVPSNSEVFTGGMNDPSAASVMAHEIGHMIMDQTYETTNYPKTSYYGAHSKNSVTDEGFAISEGWAEAIEALSTQEYHDNPTSWRIQTHQNIAQNKYIFKNQEVLTGPNDGILKSGTEQLSTEGVNASLFYKMLTDNHIQAPYSKVVAVFENSKPQTYREFLYDYVESYPEDKSCVFKQFLENTKYTTVDSSAADRYKQVHDARQALESAPTDQQRLRASLESDYQAKLAEYNQWKEQQYRKAVVEGNIDGAVDGSANSVAYSDDYAKQFKDIKLSETLLKGKKALSTGLQKAGDSIKQSFSVKNLAMTAGTTIAVNLASQIMSGEKVSLSKAVKSVASMQFVGNVVGSSLGAAAGHAIAPLIQTFVPIPIVGTIAGALLPTLASIAGGRFGGNLGAGMSLKEAFKNLDPVAIAGQGIGSTIGAMLGAMIPIPVLGPMLGGMLGGIIGEKVFTGIAKLFGWGKGSEKAQAAETPAVAASKASVYQDSTAPPSTVTARQSFDPTSYRIDPKIDRIPYAKMHPNLRRLKDEYEAAYKAYVTAVSSGNQPQAKSKLSDFQRIRDRYRQALGAYIK